MLKLRNYRIFSQKIRHTAKFVAVWLFLAVLFSSFVHPYYISVTEVKHDATKKSLQISCRIFTDNIEDALKKIYKKNIDVLNPKDKKEVEQLLADYISKHLLLTIDTKPVKCTFIGYEKEEDAIWCYLEATKINTPKKIIIENSLLYEYLPAQVNMVHVTVHEKRQSSKLTNPDKKMEFIF